MLRVDDAAGIVGFIGEFGAIALIIIIIARAHEQEVRREFDLGTVLFAVGGYRPAGLFGRPIGAHHAVAKPDVRSDAIFIGGFMDIFVDRRAVRNRLCLGPGFEPVTQRVHVRIRADAGIAEQVPGSAHIGALFDYRKALVRALHGQMGRRRNAGKPRPDNQDIKFSTMLFCRHRPSPLPVL